MKISKSAPSNIALIKYMGKVDGLGNKPANASVSYTLEHLRTHVEIERISSANGRDQWQPLQIEGAFPLALKPTGQEKFLNHFGRLKEKWGIKDTYLIKSANNFPSDCGLASSASSFAALTWGAAELFQKTAPQNWGDDLTELSRLSRQGSGSSCRSFFSPWALWRDQGAEPLKFSLRLHHAVIILEKDVKAVSSSEAHKRVLTSPRFQGRIKRAEEKLEVLLSAISQERWKEAHEVIWDEFWDMHELFHTSQSPFRYMTSECREILSWMEKKWKQEKHGPWITLDAGPNIHLLFHNEDLAFAQKYLTEFNRHNVITSWGSP